MRVRKGVGSRLEGARVRWAGKAGESKPLPISRQTPSPAVVGAKGRHIRRTHSERFTTFGAKLEKK